MHVSKNGGDTWDPVQVPSVTPERVRIKVNHLCSPQTFTLLKSLHLVKDSAYFCYCAYVLHVSRYSDFQSVSKKRICGNHAFFGDNDASVWKTMPYAALYICILRLFTK